MASFKGKKAKDNRVSAHATRLVANCIVAYNSIILNSIYGFGDIFGEKFHSLQANRQC